MLDNPAKQLASLSRFVPSNPGSLLIVLLFLAVISVSLIGTAWPVADQPLGDFADPSNIEKIGMLLFTEFVVAFEVLALALLASLVGAIYLAREEVEK